jgi:hypothetical protein
MSAYDPVLSELRRAAFALLPVEEELPLSPIFL